MLIIKNTRINSGSNENLRVFVCVPVNFFSKFPKPQTKRRFLALVKHFIIWQGKSGRSDWFFPGRVFAIRTVSVETVISCLFFVFAALGPHCHISQCGPRAQLVRG